LHRNCVLLYIHPNAHYTTCLGKDAYAEFKKNNVEDVIQLLGGFEVKKRCIAPNKTDKETIMIPAALIELCQKKPADVIKNNKAFAGKITYTTGKIRVDYAILRSWFDESCRRTIEHVRNLFQQPQNKDVDTILMVGGFSDSPILQDKIKSAFSNKRIIIPEEAGTAVLKGAVMFGHDPLVIHSRIARCSYGISVYRDFDSFAHPFEKSILRGGVRKCKDVFAPHVKKGQELVVGQAQTSQRYAKLDEKQITLDFDIYTSSEENPRFVTDPGCEHLGQLEVDVSAESGKEEGILVKMIFGGTEIVVEAENENTKKVKKATFNFLT